MRRGYRTVNKVFAETERPCGKIVTTHGGAMGQFGQELRREREDRGVSVDAICAVTKVSSRHVLALEEGRLKELPGGVFRKGIVRGYLSAVGLDEAVWMARFELNLRESGALGPEEQDWAEFAENVRRSRSQSGSPTGLRWFGVVLMLLGLLLCGWLTWKYVVRARLTPYGISARAEATSVPLPGAGTMG